MTRAELLDRLRRLLGVDVPDVHRDAGHPGFRGCHPAHPQCNRINPKDLRRLKLKGRIVQLEHSNNLRPDRRRAALCDLLHQAAQPAPPPAARGQRAASTAVRPQALRTLDRAVTDYLSEARLTA